MTTERAQVANGLRAEGEAIKEKIRADADRQQVSVIIAEATLEAQKTKGEGDAEASRHSTPTPSAATRSSRSSTAASRPIAPASAQEVGRDGDRQSSDFFKAMRGAGSAALHACAASRKK